jgi:hypothetical protein
MEFDILFLDIDGVLNPDKTKGSSDFAADCVGHLKRLLHVRPETRIVFSTSWRLGFPLFALGWLWHHHELPLQTVIGRTPDIRNDMRGHEIRAWLGDATRLPPGSRVRRYAAVDDEVEPLLECLPVNTIFRCDPYHGLTRPVADRLIKYFSE